MESLKLASELLPALGSSLPVLTEDFTHNGTRFVVIRVPVVICLEQEQGECHVAVRTSKTSPTTSKVLLSLTTSRSSYICEVISSLKKAKFG